MFLQKKGANLEAIIDFIITHEGLKGVTCRQGYYFYW